MSLLPWFALHQSFGESELGGEPLDGEGAGGGGEGGEGQPPAAQR